MSKTCVFEKTTSGRVARSPGTKRLMLSTALALLGVLGSVNGAHAQAVSWTGATDTDYGTATNWDTGATPVAGDAVTVTSGFINDPILAGAHTAATVMVTSGGDLTVNGMLTATAGTTVDGAALLTVGGGGMLTSNVTMSGPGATVTIDATGNITGNVDMTRGTLTVNGSLTGGVTSNGGNATSSVVVGATGSVSGLVEVTNGTLDNSGALNGGFSLGTGAVGTIQTGGSAAGGAVGLGTLTVATGASVTGTLTVNGGQNGGVVNSAGSLGAVVVNGGALTSTGSVSGPITVNGGQMTATGTISGALTVNAGGAFVANAGLSHVGGGAFTNNGSLSVTNGNFTTASAITNTGTLLVSDGQTLGFSTMANSGRIGLGNGTAGSISGTLDGTITNSGNATFDLNNAGGATAGDMLTVTGDLTGTTRVLVDVDLRTSLAGSSDSMVVGGLLDGDITVDGTPILSAQDLYTLQNPFVVIDAASLGGSITTDLTGLPESNSLIIYGLVQNAATSDIELRSQLNPALGGVAGAVASISSLIGTVINRPSGAYVSGIAFDAPGNCSTGSWARLSGGRIAADTATTTQTTGAGVPVPGFTGAVGSSGITEFMGLQGGVDFGCFEAFDGGWDVSGGMLFGANTGWFSQFSFGSLTRGDFDQQFIGAYVAASKGNWSGEVQLRYEDGDLVFNNPNLSLFNSEISSKGYALSGSITYRHALENNWSLLPTVGFAISRNEVSSLAFRTRNGAAAGNLQVEDHTNKTSFIGATLGKTRVDLATSSASSHFVTATYYMDHGGSRTSSFTTPGAGVVGATMSTGEIGNFGEVSVGTSYVKVLNSNPGSVRQVNASVRTDYRFGGEVDGTSLTGQVRLQF